MEVLNIDDWNRKEHFEFFSTFDNPFFGIVSEVDCTRAFNKCKKDGESFFAYCLYKSLIAANQIQEFRYRIRDQKVIIHDKVHASATIGRDDGTFGFSKVPYDSDFEGFKIALNHEIEKVKRTAGLCLSDASERDDVVHITSIPWAKITGVTHPQNYDGLSSVPKITFGKAFKQGSSMLMAVGIDAHHALMDGLHATRFIEAFQNCMND